MDKDSDAFFDSSAFEFILQKGVLEKYTCIIITITFLWFRIKIISCMLQSGQ